MNGDPLKAKNSIFEIFEKKRKMRILNSLIVPKYLKGETLWAFCCKIKLAANYQEKLKVGPGKKSKVAQCRKKLEDCPSVSSAFANARKFLAKARTRTRDRWFHRKPSKMCTNKWYIPDELWSDEKKTSQCNSQALTTRKAQTKKMLDTNFVPLFQISFDSLFLTKPPEKFFQKIF